MPPALDIQTYAGPVTVTLAYIALYYAFQIHILRVKNRLKAEYKDRGEKFDRYFGQDRHMLAADRSQLNMLEHMPGFLVLLWLNALFVGPFGATVAGGIYVAARSTYPLWMGARLGRGVQGKILLSTLPGYLVLVYFLGSLIVAMLS